MRQKVTKRNLQQVEKERTEKIQSSDRYYTSPKTPEGCLFFIFDEYGDYLFGKLLCKRQNHHINRTNSYQLAVEEGVKNGVDMKIKLGQVEEFFANRQLQRIIDRNELVGSRVRVEFVGRLKSDWGGHAAKIYEVFKDFGAITPDMRKQKE